MLLNPCLLNKETYAHSIGVRGLVNQLIPGMMNACIFVTFDVNRILLWICILLCLSYFCILLQPLENDIHRTFIFMKVRRNNNVAALTDALHFRFGHQLKSILCLHITITLDWIISLSRLEFCGLLTAECSQCVRILFCCYYFYSIKGLYIFQHTV